MIGFFIFFYIFYSALRGMSRTYSETVVVFRVPMHYYFCLSTMENGSPPIWTLKLLGAHGSSPLTN